MRRNEIAAQRHGLFYQQMDKHRSTAFTCHVDSLQLTAFVFNYNETLITKTDGKRGHVAGKIF